MNESLDAAEVDEGTEIGQRRDLAPDLLSTRLRLLQFLQMVVPLLLQQELAGEHYSASALLYP
jgi:hypothetical protein